MINYSFPCPKCNSSPRYSLRTGQAFNTHLCDCGNTYWTMQHCPGMCLNQQKTIFNQKPRFNQLMQCNDCKIQFYLFKCPIKDCQCLFTKTKDKYVFGQPLYCQKCNFTYKQFVCPCGHQTYFDPNTILIEGRQLFNCQVCHRQLTYTICTDCWCPTYHINQLQLGQKIKCVNCKYIKQFIPCIQCGRTTKKSKLNYCETIQCDFCDSSFQYTRCPTCSQDNCNYEPNDRDIIRVCSNEQCFLGQYNVIGCRQCKQSVIIEQYRYGQAREQECLKCKSFVKFYYCIFCKIFNPNDSKCSNSCCPLPQNIRSITKQKKDQQIRIQKQIQKQKEKQKANLNNINSNYNEKQCKICYVEQSKMVNQTCGHVMMCQACCKQLVKRQYQQSRNPLISQNPIQQIPLKAKCPVCKRLGFYTKVIEYIYS